MFLEETFVQLHPVKGPAYLTGAFEEHFWFQSFCLKPLSTATWHFLTTLEALSQVLEQMETIKLFEAPKKKKKRAGKNDILDMSPIKLY